MSVKSQSVHVMRSWSGLVGGGFGALRLSAVDRAPLLESQKNSAEHA